MGHLKLLGEHVVDNGNDPRNRVFVDHQRTKGKLVGLDTGREFMPWLVLE